MLEPTSATLGSWFAFARNHLDDADARALSEAAFGVNYSQLIAGTEIPVPNSQIELLRNFVRRRLDGEPVAYIVGTRGFWRREFCVSPDTLIPRPETETLIETVLPFLTSESRVLDVGTGSGALGLTIALETGARVLMTDVSCGALNVAAQNAEELKIDVQLRKSNWYDNVDGAFDCIVSNPPYVASSDKHLQNGDLLSEPLIALDGGIDGLDALRIVVGGASAYLRQGGRLAVEHGYDQAEAVYTLFQAAGFQCIALVRDLNHQPRVTHGVL
ncbi:MAG: peptide chain release factor N(5)-glutamine methyltransferase [Gammaproteobacteria bacterium]|nr:peptide chain release factor N(5)-glutamine methyltransferase [Gammaproteobacteria bacterium]